MSLCFKSGKEISHAYDCLVIDLMLKYRHVTESELDALKEIKSLRGRELEIANGNLCFGNKQTNKQTTRKTKQKNEDKNLILRHEIIEYFNRPFYSCVLSFLAFE